MKVSRFIAAALLAAASCVQAEGFPWPEFVPDAQELLHQDARNQLKAREMERRWAEGFGSPGWRHQHGYMGVRGKDLAKGDLSDGEFYRFIQLGLPSILCDSSGGVMRRVWATQVEKVKDAGRTRYVLMVNGVDSVDVTVVGVFSRVPTKAQISSLNGRPYCDAPGGSDWTRFGM